MTTQYLKLTEGTIAYDDQGNGPLVLCVPGLGDVRAEYRILAPRLAEAGYRVVTMDMRGQGESSPKWSSYTVEAVGSDMLALIRHLNAGPALLIGTSFGAGAAVCAAADAPELVNGVVLIGPFVRVLGSALSSRLMSIVAAGPIWGIPFWSNYFTSLYPTNKPADFPEYLANLKANLKEPGRLAALRGMLSDTKIGSDMRLAKVKAPVHVIMGSRDSDFKQPEQEVQTIISRLEATKSTYQMIENAGHYAHVEFPEPTTASILSFFATIETKERISNGN